jgi:Inositol monophosphatase family
MKSPELEVAEEAVRAASAILERYFREGVVMRSKEVSNLVSDADIEAERAVVAVIKREFPRHEVLAEEVHQGDVTAEDLWVIDPLASSSAFRRISRLLPQRRAGLRHRRQPDPRRVARRDARGRGVLQRRTSSHGRPNSFE